MINNCPVCGKAFDVLWPQLWRYKRNNTFVCSYTCLRAFDRKDGNEMTSITKEQKAKAIQISLGGGDPKPYLKECGSKAPDKLWYYMKNQLKVKDPETYEKLAKTAGRKKTVETPEGEFTEAEKIFFGDGDVSLAVELPEVKREYPQADELFPEFEHRITGIETQVGDFQYFRKNGYLDWTPNDGNGTVSLTVEEWKDLLKLMPKIAKRLGVEL